MVKKKLLKRQLRKCRKMLWNGEIDRVLQRLKYYPELKTYIHDDDSLVGCASYENIDHVKALVLAGCDPNLPDTAGHTVLIDAAAANNIEMVNFLLDHGADINHQANGYETAFSYACTFNYMDCAKLLYERGADINLIVDGGGGTALDWAKSFASPELEAWLRSVGGSETTDEVQRISDRGAQYTSDGMDEFSS